MLGSHHHKPHEFVAEQLLNLIGLFDGDADADGIDGALDQHSLLFIPTDDHRV